MTSSHLYYKKSSILLNGRLDEFLEKHGSGMNFEEAKTRLAEEGLDNVPKARYKERVLHYRRNHKTVKQK
jgi:hypothetical protein